MAQRWIGFGRQAMGAMCLTLACALVHVAGCDRGPQGSGAGAGAGDDRNATAADGREGDIVGSSRVIVHEPWVNERGGPAMRGLAPWGVYGSDDGRGAALKEARLVLRWRIQAPGGIYHGVVAADGVVFAAAENGAVIARELGSGRPVWRTMINASAFAPGTNGEAADGDEASEAETLTAGPCLAGDVIVVAGRDAVYALRISDGSPAWRYPLTEPVRCLLNSTSMVIGEASSSASSDSPASDGEARRVQIVLAADDDHWLHAIDAGDGSRVWRREMPDYMRGGPAVDAGRIVQGACDGRVHVLRLSDGEPLRSVDIDALSATPPAVVDGRAYVGSFDGEVAAVDVAAGRVVWRDPARAVADVAASQQAQRDRGTLEADAVTTTGSAEDRPRSRTRTRRPTPSGEAVLGAPAVDGDLVIVGARDGVVRAMARTDGREVWRFAARDRVDSGPVIIGEAVVFGSDDGRVYLLGRAGGEVLDEFELGGRVGASPAAVGGMIVVGNDQGVLACFDVRARAVTASRPGIHVPSDVE